MKQIQHVLKLGRTVCYQTLMRHAAGEPLVQRHPPRDRSRLGPTQLAGLRSLSRYNEDAYLVELQEKLHVVWQQVLPVPRLPRPGQAGPAQQEGVYTAARWPAAARAWPAELLRSPQLVRLSP